MRKVNFLSALCFSLFWPMLLASAASAQDKSKPPLSLTLTPNLRAGCVGAAVRFTATLKNIGNKAVVVDSNGMDYLRTIATIRIHYRRRGGYFFGNSNEIDGEDWIGDIARPGYKPSYRLLWPGETLRKIVRQKLEKKYLNQMVELNITYGQFVRGKLLGVAAWRDALDSNKVKLMAKNCR